MTAIPETLTRAQSWELLEASPRAFQTTHWSVVLAAGDPANARSQAALTELCQHYWQPLYVFLRRKGLPIEEAEDLTQSFLADFLARNQVSRADRARGRFRSFLVASLENFLHNAWRRRSAQRRGGGHLPVSLDVLQAEAAGGREPAAAETPAMAYDREWARVLLQRAIAALEREWEQEGRGALFQEFQAHLWCDPTAVPYAELCARFDLTPVNLRVTLHRLRQRYRELLREAVAETVATAEDIEDELRFLLQAVSR